MANAYLSFGGGGTRTSTGNIPVYHGNPTSTEIVVTGATSATSTAAAQLRDGIVSIRCDTALIARVGSAPVATQTNGWYIPANTSVQIGINQGDRVALIDAI